MSQTADSIRAVIFLRHGSRENILHLWQLLSSGEMPDAFQKIPHFGDMDLAQGRVGDFQVQLTTQPGRVDMLICGPLVDLGRPSPLNDMLNAMNFVNEKTRLFLKDITPARLAVISEHSVKTETMDEALNLWKSDLPFISFPENAIDGMFQMNTKLTSSIDPGLELNQVGRWEAMTMVLLLGNNDNKNLQISDHDSNQVAYIYKKTFDINTNALNVYDDFSVYERIVTEISEALIRNAGL